MVYKIQVTYMSRNLDEGYYISLRTEKFSFTIDEPYCYNEEIDHMIERKEGSGIGGGGNSCWSLNIKDGLFNLEYIISGMGTGSVFCQVLDDEPLLEMLNLMKKINKLREENKKYVSSSGHIKVDYLI